MRTGVRAKPRSDKLCVDIALSRRERQIMHVLYKQGRASGQEIRRSLPDPPSYSTIRTILRVLERKGWVRHTEEDLRYVYSSVVPRALAASRALKVLVETFFDSSPKQAITALLQANMFQLGHGEADELVELLQQTRDP